LSGASAAAFEAGKRREAEEAQKLGFNPYQPIFGSASQGRAAVEAVANGEIAPTMGPTSPISPNQRNQRNNATASSRPTPKSTTNQVVKQKEYEPLDALVEALALLSSHPDEVMCMCVYICLHTQHKPPSISPPPISAGEPRGTLHMPQVNDKSQQQFLRRKVSQS
jgi:hypothetical protein